MSVSIHQKRMQQIMTQCFSAVKSKLDRRLGFFDLIGCDFMVDTDFKVSSGVVGRGGGGLCVLSVSLFLSNCVFMDLNRFGCWR